MITQQNKFMKDCKLEQVNLYLINQTQRKEQKMQRSSLNIIVFDDQESRIIQQSMMKRQTSYASLGQSEVISRQLQFLAQKLKNIQSQTLKLNQDVTLKRNNIPASTEINSNSILYFQELLQVIERKIQMIIKQTQVIVSRITENFEKKLATVGSNLNKDKMLAHMKQSLLNVQRMYEQDCMRIRQENRLIETQLMGRLCSLEDMYGGKIIEFERKQKDYLDRIDQLESKVKQLRNKKLIQVTQDKSPKKINQVNNYQRLTSNLIILPNLQSNNDISTRVRKHKIFQIKNNQNKSLSPCNRVPSPISGRGIDNGRFKNDITTGVNKLPEVIPSAMQFYRDIPKAISGWQNFQDLNQNGDSGNKSEEDVFFYPDHISNQDKFLSPLDLN